MYVFIDLIEQQNAISTSCTYRAHSENGSSMLLGNKDVSMPSNVWDRLWYVEGRSVIGNVGSSKAHRGVRISNSEKAEALGDLGARDMCNEGCDSSAVVGAGTRQAIEAWDRIGEGKNVLGVGLCWLMRFELASIICRSKLETVAVCVVFFMCIWKNWFAEDSSSKSDLAEERRGCSMIWEYKMENIGNAWLG